MHYRKVWEQATGCKIPPGWHIHHVDRDRSNNAPSNLHAMPAECHGKVHDFAGRFRRFVAEAGARQAKRPKRVPPPRVKRTFSCAQCGKTWAAFESKKVYCLPVCEVRAQMGMPD